MGVKGFYEDKTILVTGGTGSIGRELVHTLLSMNPQSIRVLDNNETGLFDLDQTLPSARLRTLVGDIRDPDRIRRAVEGVDIIFHAAALKHVPLCEFNPFEAVKTNVIGTQNLIEAAMDAEVASFATISTDKAVNPINVMGASKLLAERLTISANLYRGKKKSIFSCVRFGNVMNSRGSVIPLFRSQIQRGGPVTITNPDMTRFIMGFPHAIQLILKATEMARGGEIFILKMPVVRIGDLAEAAVEHFRIGDARSIRFETIGERAGEKLYEELMTENEAVNAYEDDEMFIVLPHSRNDLDPSSIAGQTRTKRLNYSSRDQRALSKEDIRSLFAELNL